MIFSRFRSLRSTTGLAVFVCLAFVAAAVWAWDLPLAKVLQYLWICILLVLALVLAAALMLWLVKSLQKIFRRRP